MRCGKEGAGGCFRLLFCGGGGDEAHTGSRWEPYPETTFDHLTAMEARLTQRIEQRVDVQTKAATADLRDELAQLRQEVVQRELVRRLLPSG